MLNPEHLLLPYELSALPPSPWLVFAPHADDETYGMGGTLLRAQAAGIETHVIVVSDGSLGGNSEGLVARRAEEAAAACRLLGASLECWQEPDRGIANSAVLVARVVEAIGQRQAASVFFPGPLEIHPDHRATAAVVWAALQQLAQAGPAPVALSYEISVQNPINRLVDITAQRAAKEAVMAVYASQNDLNNYEELVLALDKARTFSLAAEVSHAEGFFQYAAADLVESLQAVTQRNIGHYF